jgi:hypothetical protein
MPFQLLKTQTSKQTRQIGNQLLYLSANDSCSIILIK